MDEMNQLVVSVICTVFNHEKFLRKCLDGFVMQKTTFQYEVILHDDCSTDTSKDIIKEYVQKYPDILIPVYQTENQYSQGISIVREYIAPKVRGRYIALCEGDDYWCDENKLQRQYDYMEQNRNCVLCTHNTIRHDLQNKIEDTVFNQWKTVHRLSDNEVFVRYKVHTSSFFFKRDFLEKPDYAKKYWFGDYVRLTTAYAKGEVVCLPWVMSVYNWHNPGSVTSQHQVSGIDVLLKKISMQGEYLSEYNQVTNYQYNAAIRQKQDNIILDCFERKQEYNIQNTENRKEAHRVAKQIIKDSDFYGCLRRKG